MKKGNVVLFVFLLLISNVFTLRATLNFPSWVDTPSYPSSSNTAEKEHKELNNLIQVLEVLSRQHLQAPTLEELTTAAIKGMVDVLDEQTDYMDEKQWKEMMESVSNQFSGIGINIIEIDGYITVINPITGTPGQRAGLQDEDRIIEVNGQDIIGLSVMDAAQLIRGPDGTPVILKVLRGEDTELTFEVIREKIVVSRTDFSNALVELEKQHIRGLILDLRNNFGGVLSEAVSICQEILPAGPITYLVDRDGNVIDSYYSNGAAKPYPIVALVNGDSASASEIIAGALQDTGVGTLVGTKTYGKATVQRLDKLTNNAGLKYTIAKYITPNGRDIHNKGLNPDVVVELPYLLHLYPLTRDVKKGDKNVNVSFLQQTLKTIGYELTLTGVFDKETEQAVLHFQSENALSVTGVVKRDTRKKLQEVAKAVLDQMDNQKLKAIEIIMQTEYQSRNS